MDTTTVLETAQSLLQPWSQAVTQPEPHRSDFVVAPADLLAAVQALVDARWGYLGAITGIDLPAPAPAEGQPPAESHLAALYQFFNGAAVATLRVTVSHAQPVLPSICDIIPSATIYERELIEMFGFVIENTPVTDHLLLPDDWPQNVYPLRKSFTGFGGAESA